MERDAISWTGFHPKASVFLRRRLGRLDSLLGRYVDTGFLPNALMLVARHGQVVYCNGFGMIDIEHQRPMQEDTIFRIYSMTKPMTSIAVMMLLEQGYFHLKDPVSAFIPEFADVTVYVNEHTRRAPESPMTIQHLLSHTAGLTYDFLDSSPVDKMYTQAGMRDRSLTLELWARKLAQLPLVYVPGAGWRYSMATDLLGYLVQVVSGQPFEDFLHEKLFEPLRMVDTAFYVPDGKTDRLTKIYGDGLWEIGTDHLPDFTKSPGWPSGGGGLVSTISDYYHFCRMLANGGELNGIRFVSRKTLELMAMNHVPNHLLPVEILSGPIYGYGFGLGFSVLLDPAVAGRVASAGEFGWSGLAGTHFWIDPVEEVIAIFMTQYISRDRDGMPVQRRSIHPDLRNLVYQALE